MVDLKRMFTLWSFGVGSGGKVFKKRFLVSGCVDNYCCLLSGSSFLDLVLLVIYVDIVFDEQLHYEC
jgi:hypothetical protein